jgi:hypothetical protein
LEVVFSTQSILRLNNEGQWDKPVHRNREPVMARRLGELVVSQEEVSTEAEEYPLLGAVT